MTNSATHPEIPARVRCSDGTVGQPVTGDVLPVGDVAECDVSIVCPFYNEEKILSDAVHALADRLEQKLQCSWELVIVNDGSTDKSADVAGEIAAGNPNIRLLGYRFNRGRGHALRIGIEQARGRIIVTTEIDLSWGEDIVERLLEAVEQNPDADIIVASPHLPGGGYKNVPAKRVFLSRFGNYVIRKLMLDAASMNTGMTRAYRRESIHSLPLEEDKKEFHLEVILKAQAMGYRIGEIPAVLEWKAYKHEGRDVARKSSSKINKLMVTHSLFSLFANPIRYIWPLSGVAMLIAIGFFLAGVVRLFMNLVSVYMLIVSLAFSIISLVLFLFGVLTQQGNMLQSEMWRLKQEIKNSRDVDGK